MTTFAGSYPSPEDVNQIHNGRWKRSYRAARHNVYVEVSFERDHLDNSPVQLTYNDYTDLKVGPHKVMTVLNPSAYLENVITSLHARQFERAAIFASSRDDAGIDAKWLRVWEDKRCLHLGLPNRSAMLLLTGLTKRINSVYVQGRGGNWVPDGVIAGVRRARLISEVACIPKKRRSGFMTNERGYHVLAHWAETRKGFGKFFEVYCPKNWERDYLAKQVFEKMAGADDPFIPL